MEKPRRIEVLLPTSAIRNKGEGIWAGQIIFSQRQEVIWAFVFQIPLLLIAAGVSSNFFMKLDYTSEKYEKWISLPLVDIERKLVNETAFDGIVKIYSLRTENRKVNELIKEKFFGDFIHHTNTGAFLRMFNKKSAWPKTELVYLDFDLTTLREVRKTTSSWLYWKGMDSGNGTHIIEISPSEKIEYKISP